MAKRFQKYVERVTNDKIFEYLYPIYRKYLKERTVIIRKSICKSSNSLIAKFNSNELKIYAADMKELLVSKDYANRQMYSGYDR